MAFVNPPSSLLPKQAMQSPHHPLQFHPPSSPHSVPSTQLGIAAATVAAASSTNLSHSYFLTRVVFVRALAFVYGVAFLVAWHQNKGLVGDSGITPAKRILARAERRGSQVRQAREEWLRQQQGSDAERRNLWHRWGMRWNRNPRWQKWRELLWDRSDGMGRPVTTLLWLAKDRSSLNPWLDGVALVGMGLSALVLAMGSANVPLLLALWVCQRSLMAVGGPWYGYGWEPQLAELGFHALFLVPVLSLQRYNMCPPWLVIYTIRFYLFKIMMGAGLIKIKSMEPKWRDFTAMDTFYETQPVPNPLTKYFHFMPHKWHQFEVLGNHFVELVAPFLLIIPGLPPSWRRAGGLIQLVFQAILILSGNLSFLNWLTMVPAILSLDDAVWQRFFSSSAVALAANSAESCSLLGTSLPRQTATVLFFALIARLSVPVIRNLLSKRQLMNASFDRLRLVNTYGAFGSVSDQRTELIIKSAADISGPWKEYEFQVKPGDVMQRPRWISPFHYRLDWQMWIASVCRYPERSPWMYTFLLKLLQRDKDVTALLKSDPWSDETGPAPLYIRVDKYQYKFHKRQPGEARPAPYWDRAPARIRQFYPRQGVATLGSLKDDIKASRR